jgi:hypothetical protein
MIKMGAIGVGFLLFSSSGKILTIKELEGKPEIKKEPGMISFPLETLEREDGGPSGTIKRLLWEELGIHFNQVMLWGIFPKEFHLFPERQDIKIIYGVGKFLGKPGYIFFPKDNDVAINGWLSPQELLRKEKKRIEVEPIIKHFLTTHLGEFIGE